MKQLCKNCFYSKALGALETGQIQANGEQAYICKRYPPTPIPIPQQGMNGQMVLSIQAVHPPVRSEDYCGEYVARLPEIASN